MITNNCPLCGKDSYKVLSRKKVEEVVECAYGVAYKRTVDPDKKVKHYKKVKIWDNPFFDERYKRISSYLWDKIAGKKTVLDIGCGNGGMIRRMKELFVDSAFHGLEPSKPLHNHLENESIDLIKNSFDKCNLLPGFYNIILCMGVDYLFVDHDAAMQKIQSALSKNGHLYIERNVFLNMKSFVDKPIESKEDLFWTNMLITTWFTEEQMEAQLNKYFEIIERQEYGEECSRQVGWLCSLK